MVFRQSYYQIAKFILDSIDHYLSEITRPISVCKNERVKLLQKFTYMRSKESKTKQQVIQFVSKMYIDACRRAINSDITEGEQDHQTYIITQLQQLGVPYRQINEIISYNKNDFIADLLEVAEDMKIVMKNKALSTQKFENRSRSHFGGINYNNLQKDRKERPTAKVLNMYQTNSHTWNQQKQLAFQQRVFPASVYLMGISKGNGAIIDKNCIVSCAHVFVDEQNNKLMKIRCFSNAVGGYGIVRLHQSSIIKQTDLCFAQIIHYEGPEVPNIIPFSSSLKFASQFTPLACLQVGLLYFPDENYLSTFQTAEGFIERNEYKNAEDRDLYKEQMGKLIHNCFGMWGTSGSPLWNADGQLLGLHNSWNEKGYNVSMIVHEDEKYEKSDPCWVVRQYQRRAVSIHVIEHYYERWKSTLQGNKQQKQAIQNNKLIETKKSKRIKKQKRQ